MELDDVEIGKNTDASPEGLTPLGVVAADPPGWSLFPPCRPPVRGREPRTHLQRGSTSHALDRGRHCGSHRDARGASFCCEHLFLLQPPGDQSADDAADDRRDPEQPKRPKRHTAAENGGRGRYCRSRCLPKLRQRESVAKAW